MVSQRRPSLAPVYSAIFHPHKTWADVVLGFFVSILFPFKGLAKLPPTADDERTSSYNKIRIRDRMVWVHHQNYIQLVSAYTKSTGNDLVESTFTIPRRPDLWKEWGLTKNNKTDIRFPVEDISVVLYFPKYILATKDKSNDVSFKNEGKKNARGCLELEESLDLRAVPADIPIIVFFHGGGFTMGTEYDAGVLEWFLKILPDQENRQPGQPARAILASIDYSLAPEYPFPAAPTDAATSLAYFLDVDSKRTIHVGGFSAGGALAAVSTMECVRQYPLGRIGSSLIIAPFLQPAADSVSYYQNSASSHVVPVEWLRWCFQAYLELPVVKEEEEEDELASALHHGSNHSAWSQSKWNKSDLARLIQPDLDLPDKETLTSKGAPRFLVTTNRADPLYSEGANFAARLKETGANIQVFDFGGSHFIGTAMDTEKYKLLLKEWGDAVFSSSE